MVQIYIKFVNLVVQKIVLPALYPEVCILILEQFLVEIMNLFAQKLGLSRFSRLDPVYSRQTVHFNSRPSTL